MKKKISWKDQFLNLLVVVIGITAAFQMDNWKEGRKHRSSEKVYLENLINELKIDLGELDTLIEIHKMEIRALQNVKNLSENVDLSSNPDSLQNWLNYMIFTLPFKPQNTTWHALNATGNFEIISDFNLRKTLIDVYDQYYIGIKQWDQAVQKHVDNYTFPYVVKNVPLNSEVLDVAFLGDVEFRNVVSLQLAIMQARKIFYIQTIEEVEKALKILSDKL
jgi:hypothetical protein